MAWMYTPHCPARNVRRFVTRSRDMYYLVDESVTRCCNELTRLIRFTHEQPRHRIVSLH